MKPRTIDEMYLNVDAADALKRPYAVALYQEINHGWLWIYEYRVDHDGKEVPYFDRLRLSEPIEVTFTAAPLADQMATAMAALDAQEREARATLAKTLATINDTKQRLLAITHQPTEAA